MKKNLFLATLAAVLVLAACSSTKRSQADQPAQARKDVRPVIAMGLEAQRNVGLRVAPALVQDLVEYLQVTGTVQPIDSRITHVRPPARGHIQEVLARVGDRVKAGQELARFDNIEASDLVSQYQSARAELRRLQIQQAAVSRQAERNSRLARIGAVPQKDLEASQAEQESLQAGIEAQHSVVAGLAARLHRFGITDFDKSSSPVATIRSPFPGIVIQAAAAPGQVVGPESDLFQLADLSEVWVQAEVYEKDLGRIRIGQPATILVDTYPDHVFSGSVTYIGDTLDPKTRTARVRCEVHNPQARLKLNMFASVKLPTIFHRKGLAIPAAALQQIENNNVVFVRASETTFELRQVQLGKTINGTVEVLAGISEKEAVVVDGAFHLKSILLGKEIGEEE